MCEEEEEGKIESFEDYLYENFLKWGGDIPEEDKYAFTIVALREVWDHQAKVISALGGAIILDKALDEREDRITELEDLLATAKEYIDDCAVSHHETRYKYRAQIIKKKLEDKK